MFLSSCVRLPPPRTANAWRCGFHGMAVTPEAAGDFRQAVPGLEGLEGLVTLVPSSCPSAVCAPAHGDHHQPHTFKWRLQWEKSLPNTL